mmetsp:Transcript_42741/g.65657  ORF Transcript_42741/g.65657 Transcript_42741/m.65657 type:complete len:112 (+) Transcript_42741:2267-2602(+)
MKKGSPKMKKQKTVKSVENEWRKEKRAIKRQQARQLAKTLRDRVVRLYTDKLSCSPLDFKMLGQGNKIEPLPEVVVHTINKKRDESFAEKSSTEDKAETALERIDDLVVDF